MCRPDKFITESFILNYYEFCKQNARCSGDFESKNFKVPYRLNNTYIYYLNYNDIIRACEIFSRIPRGK